ncbi:MAG: hypothetical protein IT326_01615 [Anaerolineae bacterium]|nr:hypothetical protein [Anaerolineae bacterium]
MSQFFEFGDNSHHTRGYAWAYSIDDPPPSYTTCDACGAIHTHFQPGGFGVKIEDGSKWPDILGCGHYPLLILSGRVVDSLKAEGIANFHTAPVHVVRNNSRRLKAVAPPAYYVIDTDGRCQIDLQASGLSVVSACAACGHRLYTGAAMHSMVPGSWDGTDLFRDADNFPMVNFCTERVFRLAGECRWTNFRFEPMGAPLDHSSRGMKYM